MSLFKFAIQYAIDIKIIGKIKKFGSFYFKVKV